MFKITKDWLKEKYACREGYEWSLKQVGIEKGIDIFKFLNMLVKKNHWNWANWVIVRVMTRPQYLKYAIFAAECVIDIYEKKYPNNKAPREAIEAAKAVVENDTQENRDIAIIKRRAAVAVADAAYAAYAAAYAVAAAYAAAARKAMQNKILKYGISLLKELPALYKRSPIKPKTEADKVKEEGRY